MVAFYERLFTGDTVSAAVTAGRQQLFRHNGRPSPKGDLPLDDWLVPVHYLRRDVRFTETVTARPTGYPPLEEALAQPRSLSHGDSDMLAPTGGVFTGRDGLFYELESATQHQRVVVLHGPAGIGKTELAKAFGRWWQETNGVEHPEWVFWRSFEPELAASGLDGVIMEIGLAVYGPDFARLDDSERIVVVRAFLQARRALLIWDNFESVRSMQNPSAALAQLSDIECEQLSSFLLQLAAGGRSAVLITSRSDEAWLDNGSTSGRSPASVPGVAGLRRIRVAGLQPQEAVAYADELLAPYRAAMPRRATRAFGELMQWLDGHPLSMRLVLPYLETTDPEALMAGLQGTAPLPGWDSDPLDRVGSLSASLGYSFTHLTPAARRLLVAICLFHGTVVTDILAVLSGQDGVAERFRGIVGQTWASALDAAAKAGLLTALGGGMYRIHPALPAYLAALWRNEDPEGYESQRAAATRGLLSAYAALGDWLLQQLNSSNAGNAYNIIGLLQRTMCYLLGYALDGKHWAEAQAIAQPLDEYWKARGHYSQARAWTAQARRATEDVNGKPPLDSPAGSLWLFFVDSQAVMEVTSGNLDVADRTCREILGWLQAEPSSPTRQRRLGVIFGQLGIIAQRRGQLDQATDWYAKALAINREYGHQPGIAENYEQLGQVAQLRGQLEDAARWYGRSLAISRELGDRPAAAPSRPAGTRPRTAALTRPSAGGRCRIPPRLGLGGGPPSRRPQPRPPERPTGAAVSAGRPHRCGRRPGRRRASAAGSTARWRPPGQHRQGTRPGSAPRPGEQSGPSRAGGCRPRPAATARWPRPARPSRPKPSPPAAAATAPA